MNLFENKSILHLIQRERVENGIIRDCLITLEKANEQVKAELRKTDGVTTKARYKELQKYYKTVAKELKNHLYSDMEIDEFIEYELKSQIKLARKYGHIQFLAPNKEQLITSAVFKPYSNTGTFATYLDSVESEFFSIWDSNVRLGYLNGLTTQQIVRNVMGKAPMNAQVQDFGAIQRLRNSIQLNTRTALQSFANETKRMVYENNSNLITSYKWSSALDRRTCIVCGRLDGKVEHKISDFENPPIHYNCRCTILPVIKGYEELQGSTRSSENGYVDGKITFEEWLKAQDEETQKDVLGTFRYNQFKKGVPMKSFVSDNKIIRIKDLDL